MAARLNTRQIENTRKAIKTTLLVKKIQNHILGDEELSQTQIAAAKILLGKAMPDLKVLDLSGEIDHKHTVKRIDLSGNSE